MYGVIAFLTGGLTMLFIMRRSGTVAPWTRLRGRTSFNNCLSLRQVSGPSNSSAFSKKERSSLSRWATFQAAQRLNSVMSLKKLSPRQEKRSSRPLERHTLPSTQRVTTGSCETIKRLRTCTTKSLLRRRAIPKRNTVSSGSVAGPRGFTERNSPG